MYRLILFTCLACSCMLGTAQNARKILKKSYVACINVQSGTYDLTHTMKYMSGTDTTVRNYKCAFDKTSGDSLFPSFFHYKEWSKGEDRGDVMYSGKEFITSNSKSKIHTLTSVDLWSEHIKAISHNFTLYLPLVAEESHILNYPTNTFGGENKLEYRGVETIHGNKCWQIQLTIFPIEKEGDMIKTNKHIFQFWINQSDYIPVKYTDVYFMEMNGEELVQYANFELNSYSVSNKAAIQKITPELLSEGYTTKDYEPYVAPPLLPMDTIAPNWKLNSVNNDSVALSELNGQVVLVDFFYKSCYPCLLALPHLQALHEKYKDKGVQIIGIDPYDERGEAFSSFLEKQGVSYTVLLEAKEVVKKYRVSGYPTMYLIDKKGNIAFSQVGFGEGLEEEIEAEIVKLLEN